MVSCKLIVGTGHFTKFTTSEQVGTKVIDSILQSKGQRLRSQQRYVWSNKHFLTYSQFW